MEQIKFMLGRQWTTNPTNASDSRDANKVHKLTSVTLEGLANLLVNGYSFRPSVLENGIKSYNWVSQQIFVLDINSKDNTIQIEDIYNFYVKCGIIPCFVYATNNNHSIKISKFRFVFCASEEITDGSLRDKLQATLMGLTDCCDKLCSNRARYFYGSMSHEVLYPNYDARVDANFIINTYWTDKKQYTNHLLDNSKNLETPNLKHQKYDKRIGLQDNVDVISRLDVEGLKIRLRRHKYNYISDINLSEYLGVLEDDYFRCILPSHDDDICRNLPFLDNYDIFRRFPSLDYDDIFLGRPSLYNDDICCPLPFPEDAYIAAFIRKAKASQLYICNCSDVLDIIQITCKLSSCTTRKAIKFLTEVYDIKHAYLFKYKFYTIYKDYEELPNSDEFIREYPNLHTILQRRELDFKDILYYMKNEICFSYNKDTNPFFFLCTQEFLDYFEEYKKDSLSKTLILFRFLGLFTQYDYLEMPITNKSVYGKLAWSKNDINFLRINPLTYDNLQKAERLSKELIEYNTDLNLLTNELFSHTNA